MTTITPPTWQRREHARRVARRRARTATTLVTFAAVGVLLGIALAVLGQPYLGALLGVTAALAIVRIVI